MKTIKDLYRNYQGVDLKKTPANSIGVEIEVELENDVPLLDAPYGWRIEGDGSLRGIGYEFVSKPYSPEGILKACNVLKNYLKEEGVVISNSVRAGIHVHLDVSEYTMQQVGIFSTLYYILEKDLVEWCGPNRSGNAFCLRVQDAEGVVDALMESLALEELPHKLLRNNHRYSSLNFVSLYKYGTLEFRALQTYPDLDKLETWIMLLDRLRRKTLDFKTINEVIVKFSEMRPRDFALDILGPTYFKEIYPDGEVNPSHYIQGMRAGQDISRAKHFLLNQYGELL